MSDVTLLLTCGHETHRTVRGEPYAGMAGVYVACAQCRRLRPVAHVEVALDESPAPAPASA